MIKSVRLTHAIRSNIIDAMMAQWVIKNPCPHNIKEMEIKIGEAIWKANFGKLPLNKIPPRMLKHSDTIKVQVSGTVKKYSLETNRPHPFSSDYNEAIVQVFDQPTPAMLKLIDATQEIEQWEKEKKEFCEEITVILNSVGTTKQLVELWPEAEQYLPPFAADPSKIVNLPALATSRLNAALGIK